jgi:excisionase family DNA binding protein
MFKEHCAQDVPMKRLFSVKELVKEVGATEWYWRTQIWSGRLPYVQVGRKKLIDRDDIDKFISKNKYQELT